jgi:hypothetical protein
MAILTPRATAAILGSSDGARGFASRAGLTAIK